MMLIVGSERLLKSLVPTFHGWCFVGSVLLEGEREILFSIAAARGSTGDHYFMGPGLEEMIEQLSISSPQPSGPPQSSRSSINAMPTIKITQSHLSLDSQCPICMEKFELGSEASQMSCKHMYHTDCVVPWLAEHNSCPICHYEMPTQGSTNTRPRRNRFSFWWLSSSS